LCALETCLLRTSSAVNAVTCSAASPAGRALDALNSNVQAASLQCIREASKP